MRRLGASGSDDRRRSVAAPVCYTAKSPVRRVAVAHSDTNAGRMIHPGDESPDYQHG